MTRFTRTAPPPTANDPPTPKPPRPLAFATAPRSAGDADDAASASGGTRFERKYLLREAEADVVSRFLAARLTADGHTSNARYTVRSLYFDTPDFADYRAKLDGDPVRRKFRLRTYGDAPGAPVRLERKSRAGQVYRKERTWLGDADLARLRDRSGPGPGTPGVLGQLLYAMERWAYAPVVLVVYERQAYGEVPGDDIVRVTLDRRLRARAFPAIDDLFATDGLVPVLERAVILEVKFSDVVPRTLRALTARYPLTRQACSKYASAVAAVIGGAPSRAQGWSHGRDLRAAAGH